MTAILIVRLGALGDVVHAMPVVSALRRRWPQSRIDWLVDPHYVDTLHLLAGLDRAIPFDPRGLAGGERTATLATIRELRGGGYDMAIDLQGLVKSAAAARLAGAAQTVGFEREELREPAARYFYSRMENVPAGLHVVRKNLALISALTGREEELTFDLNVRASAAVDAVLAKYGGSGFAVLNPGAAWPNKRWPAERFGALAAEIRARHELPSLVTWGPGEEALAHAVEHASGGVAVPAPPTDTVDLFGVMKAARLVVSGDTGPLHIASAVGTPVVALFGPTLARRNGPWAPEDMCVSRSESCECPYERTCRRAVPCLDEITVEEVVAAVDARILRQEAGR